MISTLNTIKNNFMLKVFEDSYKSSEAAHFIDHRSKFKDALIDITFKNSCNESEFSKFLIDIEINKNNSSQTESILKLLKSDDNISSKHGLISEYCEITNNLWDKTFTLKLINHNVSKYCDTFSPYRPIEGNSTKFTELLNNPKISITQELFIKFVDNLTISTMHYLDLLIEYSSINGFLSMLIFCPRIVIVLSLYQAVYFIKNQCISSENFSNFLINIKDHFLRTYFIYTRISSSFIPNINFYFGFVSTGLLGGAYYLFSIKNYQTGSFLNLLTKIPQLNIHEDIKIKYALPPYLLPFKTFFTTNFLPVVYHLSSIGSEISTACLLGCFGEKNILMIQDFTNNLSTYLNKKK
jgi:hypothetical protein